jgi:hypothetical protein
MAPTASETKLQYLHPKGGAPATLSQNALNDLRAVHWSTGTDQSGREWKSTGASELARNLDEKYEAKKPMDTKDIAKALRKVSIDFACKPTPTGQTEKQGRFQGLPVMEHQPVISHILGKELATSHIDFSNGQDNSAKDWMGMQAAELSRHEDVKFACKPPNAARDTAELRVSSIPLGSQYE